jgi:hypothetical protein
VIGHWVTEATWMSAADRPPACGERHAAGTSQVADQKGGLTR